MSKYKVNEVDFKSHTSLFITEDDVKLNINEVVDLLNEKDERIKALAKRNNNQYEQLNELWDLINDRNWSKLTEMEREIREADKRLQEELEDYPEEE